MGPWFSHLPVGFLWADALLIPSGPGESRGPRDRHGNPMSSWKSHSMMHEHKSPHIVLVHEVVFGSMAPKRSRSGKSGWGNANAIRDVKRSQRRSVALGAFNDNHLRTIFKRAVPVHYAPNIPQLQHLHSCISDSASYATHVAFVSV
jgi:hypothetical protein